MIFSRKTGLIGIDIGTHTVKVAQVERRGTRIELVEALSIPRQEPWSDSTDDAADVSSSVEIQAAIALGTRFRGRDAAVTLPMAVCDVRTCNIEGNTDFERRAAVLQELESVSAHTPRTREFDYWSVESTAESKGNGDNTIALSVASSWAARVAQDLREAGLVGQVLDGLPLAAARAVALGNSRATQLVAAVDWGHHRATLCCVKGGRPLFVRGLRDCGFKAINQAVGETLGVSADEAQKLLREHGLPSRMDASATELQSVLEEVAREPLDCLVDELKRTLVYLSQQRRGLSPATIVLMGGGAVVKNVCGYLSEQVGLPVETWCLDDTSTAATAAEQWRPPIELFGPAIALSTLGCAAAGWSSR